MCKMYICIRNTLLRTVFDRAQAECGSMAAFVQQKIGLTDDEVQANSQKIYKSGTHSERRSDFAGTQDSYNRKCKQRKSAKNLVWRQKNVF